MACGACKVRCGICSFCLAKWRPYDTINGAYLHVCVRNGGKAFVDVVCRRVRDYTPKNTKKKYCRILSERTEVTKCKTKQTVCVSVSRFVGAFYIVRLRAHETNRYKWPDCNRSLFLCSRFRCGSRCVVSYLFVCSMCLARANHKKK